MYLLESSNLIFFLDELKPYFELLGALTNLVTLAASILAMYVYWTNRNRISTAIELLLNYSFQTTLSELKGQLDRLMEYNANESTEIQQIQNILHEIVGQMRGNDRLMDLLGDLPGELERLAKGPRLTEQNKRLMVSKTREQLKTIQIKERL